MDDEFDNLETELKRMRPASPSRELVARIEHELATPAALRAPGAWLRWLWIAALPAAAAITVIVLNFSPRAEPSAPVVSTAAPAVSGESTLKPLMAENLLVSARDEGLVTLDDGTQARRERRQYIDTITWRNPRTHASLTWSVPREEVLVVPVAFQ